MDDFIYYIDYAFDTDRLLDEYPKYKAKQFSSFNPKWKRVQASGSYADYLAGHFQQYARGAVIAGYWEQPANTKINKHTDKDALCRINVRLSEDNGILHIDGHEYTYDAALLNVNEYPHWVTEVNNDRLIFSIIFLEDDYRSVRDEIKGE